MPLCLPTVQPTSSTPFLRHCLLTALLSATAVAQFSQPYSGVNPTVRSTPLPIVVMKYEPNTPYSHARTVVFGRDNKRIIQLAKDRGSSWFKRTAIPFQTGLLPADDPVPFRNPDGSVASLFVLGSDRIIYQATTSRHAKNGDWSAWASLPSNVAMASSCSAVNTPNGLGVSVFAVGVDGYLYNAFFTRGGSGGWGSWYRVPGSPANLRGRPAVVNSTDSLVVHIFTADGSGTMHHNTFTRGGQGGWAHTALQGAGFLASPSCYALGSIVSVFATGTNGQVYQAVNSNSLWGAWGSLGGASTGTFVSGPAAVNSPDETSLDIIALTSAGIIEKRTYARGSSGWSNWTAFSSQEKLTSGPTLANWHTMKSTTGQTRARMFDPAQSVAHWFDENSFGKYRIGEAFISNWNTMPDDPNTAVDESSYAFFHGGDYAKKAQLMIQSFETLTGFRFANYDSNLDGKVTTDELMIYWEYPGESARVRGAPLCISVPSLSGCGVSLDLGLPRGAAHIGPEIITEELCHALFGLDDLYETSQLPSYVGPGRLSMISNNAAFPHLHPWGKMKLGWIQPTIVAKDGWYSLRPIEQHPDLLVVHDPARGDDDYFMVENRWPNGSIEHALPDRGFGMWRISEHYQNASFWGRRTIKLLRAGGGKDDSVAFWDAGDARTAYHLTTNSVPASTRWDDGSASNIAFYHFSGAGQVARVFVDVPPLRSTPPAPYRAAAYTYLNQSQPYQNQSPNWLTAQTMPVLGSTLKLRVPMSSATGQNINSFFLATGFSNPGAVHPLLNGYQYASLDIIMPVPFGAAGQFGTIGIPVPADVNLPGLTLFQQVLRAQLGQGFPLSVSRGGKIVVGF